MSNKTQFSWFNNGKLVLNPRSPYLDLGGASDKNYHIKSPNSHLILSSSINNSQVTISGTLSIGSPPSGTSGFPMVVTSDGNPFAAGYPSIVLVGSSNKERIEIRGFGSSTPALHGLSGGGTINAPTQTTATVDLLAMVGRGVNDSNAFTGNTAIIRFRSSQAFTTTAQGSEILFELTPNNSTTRSEVIRIGENGKLILSQSISSHIEGAVSHLILSSSIGSIITNSGSFRSTGYASASLPSPVTAVPSGTIAYVNNLGFLAIAWNGAWQRISTSSF